MHDKKQIMVWALFGLLSAFLLIFLLVFPAIKYGGDLAEYYGTTESLLNHFGVHLTAKDQESLEKVINPVNFRDPLYYIPGRDGQRYPVHFIFYSILAAPVRAVLQVFHLETLNVLRILNVLVFSAIAYYILRRFHPTAMKKFVFLLVAYLSPLLSFFIWPGPDLFVMGMLLLSLYFFYEGKITHAIIAGILASWHSQPLMVYVFGLLLYYAFPSMTMRKEEESVVLGFNIKKLLPLGGFVGLLFVPYLYNLYAFGVLSPWVIFQDGWTRMFGFGIHNASLQKLFEQFFDLNMGVFWYAPILVIGGMYMLFTTMRVDKKTRYLAVILLITAFFYQTNPAWHYGTSGYGPSRHILFLVPVLVYFFVRFLTFSKRHLLILAGFILTQVYVLSFNGFLTPNFSAVLQHSPYARYVLDNYPALYNPTPEIFVDRTNNTDLKHITTAIYKTNGICKKAYVLMSEKQKAIDECGYIPKEYEKKFIYPYAKKVDYKRTTWTAEATFWADPASCGRNDYPSKEKPYSCMLELGDVIKQTGVADIARWKKLAYPGAWKLEWGDPVKVTIPPGYYINHFSFDGIYVTY